LGFATEDKDRYTRIMNKEELKKRIKVFAISIFKFSDELPKIKSVEVISYQLSQQELEQ